MGFSGFCVVHSQTEENCLFGWAQAAVPSVYDLMVCWVGIWLLWPSSNSHWTGHCLRLFKQSHHGWVRFLNTYLLEFKYKQSDRGVAHSCPVINPSRIKLLRHQRFHVSTLRWVGYYSLIPVFLCLGTKTYQTPWSRNLVVVIPWNGEWHTVSQAFRHRCVIKTILGTDGDLDSRQQWSY